MNVLVIVPTYNERENLPRLVPEVMAHGYRMMVVDDHSPDGTGEVAEQLARQYDGRIHVIHRTGPRGLGRSYVEGIARALETDADVICQMDADLSHDPKYLPAMIEAVERHDMAIGSRYLSGVSVVNWPLNRLILSVTANRYICTVLGLSLHDCTSGFRCWRREMLAQIPLERIVSEGYAFIVETLYEAVRRGARVKEVPIIFVERRHGTSKLSLRVLVESVVTPWRLVGRRLAEGNRAPADQRRATAGSGAPDGRPPVA
jgi:dolichol-phosphate mannosyltransferase